jgi:hypothetical protein
MGENKSKKEGVIMTNLHTRKLQTKFNDYPKKLSEHLTKPESRFVHETV